MVTSSLELKLLLFNMNIIFTSTKMKFCRGYVFGSVGLSVCLSVYVCLLAGLLKSYERISMKFS